MGRGGTRGGARRMPLGIVVTTLLALAALIPLYTYTAPPVYAAGQGSPRTHQGTTPKSSPTKKRRSTASPGTLVWHYQAGGNLGAIGSYGGTIYTCSNNAYNNGTVYALNIGTGQLLWTFTTPSAAFTCSVVNGIVYVGTQQTYIAALDASTGALLWSYQAGGSIDYMGPVVNGVLYFGTSYGWFYALDANTGALRWLYKTPTNAFGIGLPAVANGIVYFGADDSYVYALDASAGTLLWRFQTGGSAFVSNPVVAGSTVYIGSADHYLYALGASTGTQAWRYQAAGAVRGLSVASGVVYFNCDNGYLYALNLSSQTLRWNYQAGASYTVPLVADGVVYFGSGNADLYALDGDTGSPLWTYLTASSIYFTSPIAVDGIVYVGTSPGGSATSADLYAIVASPPSQLPATGPQSAERQGDANSSELGYCRSCAGDPIDTYSGNFTHTFTDITIPGRGLALAFSHTYNAAAAARNGPLGYGWTDSYHWALGVDGSGNVTITQENGSTVTFAPDGSGGAYTAPSRVLATLGKNGDGTYTFMRERDRTRYSFNTSGQLTAETDRNGYVTSLAYNGGGQLTTVTDPAGRTLSLAYDSSGRIVSVTDSSGRSVTFTYDGSGNLQSFTDVAGGVTSFTYDSNHLLLTMTGPRGGVVTSIYDSSGRVTKQTDAMGRATTFSYTGPDSNGNSTTTITDPRGNVTVEQYYNGLLLSRTEGYGTAQAATWSYTYDPLSLGVASITDPNGDITSQTWDAQGNLLSTTDPLGRTTSRTYDAQNDPLSVTDATGVTTTNAYDAHGNLLSATTPLVGAGQSRTTAYTYGDTSHPGDVTAMTDPDGKTWTYTYDAYGDRASTTDPLGEVTQDAYNVLGERAAETNALGYTTKWGYDAFGDVTGVTDPLAHATAYQYDAGRNLTQVTDADGNVTTNTYDLDNELTKVTRADGTTLGYAYDGDGNQTAQTDGLLHTTTYAYDPLNRLVSLTDPLNRVTSYGYDPAGNRTSQTAPGSLVTSYTYDAANELTGISYSDGKTPNVTEAYDADGRRVSMRDGTGTTTSTYDSLGRLTSVADGAGNTVGYGYDLAGRLTSLTYPGGTGKVTRGYDAAGRLASVTDWLGHVTRFSYDKAGALSGIAYPNHVVGALSYDIAGHLLSETYNFIPCVSPCSLAWRLLAGFTYTRDAAGMLASAKTTGIAQPGEIYSYTSLNQLASVAPSSGSATSYVYDKADEPTQLGAATLSVDSAGEVTGLTQGTASTTFSYDSRGNRVTMAVSGGATVSYGYDEANRLTSVTGIAAGTTTYAYNGDGLRMSKTVGSASAERFVWDTAEGMPLLMADGATVFVTGPGGLPLEQITGSGSGATALYDLTDQLGSVRALVDGTGAVAATYTYDAYGATTAHTGTATTPLRFAGQYVDAETGLYQLRARYYDAATAQFMSRDPLVPLTKQPYVYAGDDPLNATDPSGMFSWTDLQALAHSISDASAFIPGPVGSVIGIASDATAYTADLAIQIGLLQSALSGETVNRDVAVAALMQSESDAAHLGLDIVTAAYGHAPIASLITTYQKIEAGVSVVSELHSVISAGWQVYAPCLP